jgi:hypothetical protein
MAAWFQQQADLTVTKLAPVAVGGLSGVVVDLRIKAGTKHPSCIDDGKRLGMSGLFGGLPPSDFAHNVPKYSTMRLFMLSRDGGVLGIELDDIDKAPGDLDQLTAVARMLQFGS